MHVLRLGFGPDTRARHSRRHLLRFILLRPWNPVPVRRRCIPVPGRRAARVRIRMRHSSTRVAPSGIAPDARGFSKHNKRVFLCERQRMCMDHACDGVQLLRILLRLRRPMERPVQLAYLHLRSRSAQPRSAESSATKSIATASHSAAAASTKAAIPATAPSVSSAAATQSSTSKLVLRIHNRVRPHP